MLLLLKKQQARRFGLPTRLTSNFGTFDKILFLIRRFLNKMANEQNRTFNLKENSDKSLTQQGFHAKNLEEISKIIHKSQKALSYQQKSRLARIDQILGTNTYYHEPRQYEQKISVDNIIQIQQLKENQKQIPRNQLDLINPKTGFFQKKKNNRKLIRWMKNLRQYPSGRANVTQFNDKTPAKNENLEGFQNSQLIKFLGEETLYTRLALSDLKLTIQSVDREKIMAERQGHIVDVEEQQRFTHWNSYVYFHPKEIDTLYRIDEAHFSTKLIYSIEALGQAVLQNKGNIIQVMTIEEIYECLKKLYYDDRVNELLKRIENQQFDTLFYSFEKSPDGQGIIAILDLFNDGKQYVGLYKTIGQGEIFKGIHPQNILFNFLPDVALRNNGELYYVQRSEEGVYTQFCKILLNTSPGGMGQKKSQKESKQKYLKQHEKENEEKRLQKNSIQSKILFKCKPFEQFRIVCEYQQSYSTNGKITLSQNIVLEKRQIGQVKGNLLYLITHTVGLPESLEQYQSEKNRIQVINANNQNMKEFYSKSGFKDRYPSIYEEGLQGKDTYSQCIEVMGVGYMIVRYKLTGEKLMHGNNVVIGTYVTLVPYKGYQFEGGNDEPAQQQELILESQQLLTNNEKWENKSIQQVCIRLPTEEELREEKENGPQLKELQVEREQVIYICPENQYINKVQVVHASPSNVYMLVNLSLESVYNRNSLYIHPLRKGVNPYSIILDGYPIRVNKPAYGTGKLSLALLAPLIKVPLQYTLWKREIKQILNDRIYTENITIRQSEESNLSIKIVSSSKFSSQKLIKPHQSQTIILYIPSNDERLNEYIVMKMLQKGVIFVQITQCRGMFGSTMIQLLRGTQQFYQNYTEDIYDTIVYLKKNVGERISVYAEGPSSCYATLLMNILYNQESQLFDASVLHEGLYDTSQIPSYARYFFGDGKNIANPYKMKIYNPNKSIQNMPQQQANYWEILNLSNIVFSSLHTEARAESRKFICKLRNHQQICFQSVYLKQFDWAGEKDLWSLSYLFQAMHKKIKVEYDSARKQKAQARIEQEELKSRTNKDRIIQENEKRGKSLDQ